MLQQLYKLYIVVKDFILLAVNEKLAMKYI